MDHLSSSTTPYNQERDWLSCSTSIHVEDDNNHEKGGEGGEGGGRTNYGVVVVEREHMFDKVVTPSDVGKLNRLVIPKQHAEKYFPLDSTNNNSTNNSNNVSSSGGAGAGSGSVGNNSENKTGLLLNFEDRTGKSWRFRYSYWNSSQSYVMTKGWSRFVKEKQLSAGDIVSFQRAVGDDIASKNTFFIDWRRRPPEHHLHHHHHLGTAFSVHHSLPSWRSSSSSNVTPTFFLRSHPHESHPHPHSQPHHNAIWDHFNITNSSNNNFNNFNNNNFNNNNNNNVGHLSPPMNGNIMSMVPYAHGGSGFGSGSGTGSLILLRSPVPNSISSSINHSQPYLIPNSHQHLNHSPWTSGDTFQGSSSRRDHIIDEPMVYDSVPIVHGNKPPALPSAGGAGPGNGKRSLRLFGVNMEYDHQLQQNGANSPTTLSSSSTSTTSNFNAPNN